MSSERCPKMIPGGRRVRLALIATTALLAWPVIAQTLPPDLCGCRDNPSSLGAFDTRDPYNPKEVAHFIPSVTQNTDYRCGPFQGDPNVCRRVVQTNNVATDDRGYIYIVDRADTGMHILRLDGEAKEIAGRD